MLLIAFVSNQEEKDALKCSRDECTNELFLSDCVTHVVWARLGYLLLILKLAHNLISCTTAFQNRPLVTFIFKIHLGSADQKLPRVELQVGSSLIMPGLEHRFSSSPWQKQTQEVSRRMVKRRAGLGSAHPCILGRFTFETPEC